MESTGAFAAEFSNYFTAVLNEILESEVTGKLALWQKKTVKEIGKQ